MSALGFLLALALFHSPQEDSAKVVALLDHQGSLIKEAAELYGVKPRILTAVIYAERLLNYNWQDDALDELLAVSGYNSSIGFCQIKLKTAYWIQKNLQDERSPYYLGKGVAERFPVSRSTDELIDKLKDDRTNIEYAAAYLAMFQRRWKRAGIDMAGRPEILGTLYSTGPYRSDSSERQPHAHPLPNRFGNVVLQFYNSDALIKVFPK